MRALVLAGAIALAACGAARAEGHPTDVGWVCPWGFVPFREFETLLPGWDRGPMRAQGCRIGFRGEVEAH